MHSFWGQRTTEDDFDEELSGEGEGVFTRAVRFCLLDMLSRCEPASAQPCCPTRQARAIGQSLAAPTACSEYDSVCPFLSGR